MKLEYKATEKDQNKKVFDILIKEFLLSKKLIKKLKNADHIKLNNKPVRVIERISQGDFIEVNINFSEDSINIKPEYDFLDVLYEDASILAVNKPPQMPVHPSIKHQSSTLANRVVGYYQSNGLNTKIRPVNRLDKDTSGIVIFAKNQHIQERLIQSMRNDNFKKVYIGLVTGQLPNKFGTIDLPIARKETSIIERVINDNGKKSLTQYKCLKEYNDYSLVKFNLITGRTHQIRVHCKAIGNPLLGETLYSNKITDLINRQALHAVAVSFTHPINKTQIKLTAPIPQDILKLINSQNK